MVPSRITGTEGSSSSGLLCHSQKCLVSAPEAATKNQFLSRFNGGAFSPSGIFSMPGQLFCDLCASQSALSLSPKNGGIPSPEEYESPIDTIIGDPSSLRSAIAILNTVVKRTRTTTRRIITRFRNKRFIISQSPPSSSARLFQYQFCQSFSRSSRTDQG